MRRFFNRQGAHASPPIGNYGEDLPFEDQAATLIPAEVRMIAGCHSEQTSADVANADRIASLPPSPAGRAGGAATVSLLEILYRHQTISFQSLLVQLRASLSKKGMSQIPQLTSSRPLEMKETPFSLNNGQGKSRALLVGINYVGQYPGELAGCHNDILNVQKYLVECQGYSPKNILILMDDGKHIFPTRQKIILGLQQLVQQSKPGDNAYFHYSGHGGLLDPQGFNAFKSSHKEYDETLYPVDHQRAGQIRDFSLFHHFVKPMAEGVTVTCVMDCCHSGTVLDLPYSYKPSPGGMITMERNMDSLSNLAFLYILAGGLLPHHGFGNVTDNLESNLDGDLDGYQGVGVEEIQEADMVDDSAFQQATDYTGAGDYLSDDYGDGGEFEDYGEGFNGDGAVVQGTDVVDPTPYTDADPGTTFGDGYGMQEGAGDDVFRGADQTNNMFDGTDGGNDMFGGFDGADAADGDCACGEGLGDILSTLMDAAGEE